MWGHSQENWVTCKDCADFLHRFAQFTGERSIPWVVIGSHAMLAHAKMANIEPRREVHDLDLIVFLRREFDWRRMKARA